MYADRQSRIVPSGSMTDNTDNEQQTQRVPTKKRMQANETSNCVQLTSLPSSPLSVAFLTCSKLFCVGLQVDRLNASQATSNCYPNERRERERGHTHHQRIEKEEKRQGTNTPEYSMTQCARCMCVHCVWFSDPPCHPVPV